MSRVRPQGGHDSRMIVAEMANFRVAQPAGHALSLRSLIASGSLAGDRSMRLQRSCIREANDLSSPEALAPKSGAPQSHGRIGL
jgi:hypothetical protein